MSFPSNSSTLFAQRYFFAQGTCGAPLPGGSKIIVNPVAVWPDSPAGPRVPLVHFYMQPGDWTLEPHRRLLSEAAGLSNAKVNFDPTTHPSKDFGYPIQLTVEVPSCVNMCSGDLKPAASGLYCDRQSGHLDLTVNYELGSEQLSDAITEGYIIDEVDTCWTSSANNVCAAGAYYSRGVCTCGSGTSNKNGVCVANP